MTVVTSDRFAGRVAIVTGAGSTPGAGVGTGKATAIVLARGGAHVLLVDLHLERAAETGEVIRQEGGSAEPFQADVSTSAGAAAMVSAAVERFGGLDVLVNNIGVGSFGDVVECDEEHWDQTFRVNLRTAFLASKHSIPVMVDGGGGAIVNVSSIAGFRGVGHAAYAASKGAMQALTVDMAYSHGRQGIRVNAVAPGHIDTPLMRSTMEPGPVTDQANILRTEASLLGTEGGGWDVAHAVAFLASGEARWITGAVLPVDGGTTTVAPLMLASRFRAAPGPGGG